MEDQHVRSAIQALIERKEKRIAELRLELKRDSTTPNRMVEIAILIDKLDHGICTLIEMEHNLRLCDCPDEAYAAKSEVK